MPRITVEKHFAAVHGGRLWDSPDPAAIAPWAASAGEPVLMRIALGARVKAAAFRIPRDQDPTEYLSKIADVMETDLRRTASGENP